ncbi:MAG: peptide chain release factor 3 ['Candidatus Kapabacteria' thiocyanatum]|mgnify:FL=1|uniref:Peptide chain release factor 3 n=1 Tax=Candidatus Kapaibacterium thiocyanatum TaxID=1895771 RepID=A0A1M3KY61_9BACT|nr:peptide chain release factor 3 ['Candidatus Kapabacteria' thiocyanatum]OJX57352.1 MAG: peptide chain release factor 3 ['Candidatus Kapabacteria' thiocyanatum]
MSDIIQEIGRRRTVAIISHPDAGKTTLTEKLLLYSGAIHQAGAVTGGKHSSTTSDWMEIEQQRGISVSSSAMRVEYDGHLLNILDTPGHQDFSEDTYRTLMAVDSAIMLLDAGRGVQEQTIKLFKVCRDRGIPIITFMNKLDRPARNPLELLDEVEQVLGITAIPRTWPIGDGQDFRGIYDRDAEQFYEFERTVGNKYKAPMKVGDIRSEHLRSSLGPMMHDKLLEDLEFVDHVIPAFDRDEYLHERCTPVYWGSAITNFGLEHFLQQLLQLAPAPQAFDMSTGSVKPESSEFTGFVYKVQANMNKAHRDRISFVRIVSGRFERGMTAFHPRSGKETKLNYPFQIFGRDREIIDEAFPGDVIGLTNPGLFRVGDTITTKSDATIPNFPRFAPEIYAKVFPAMGSFSKSFRKGIDQLAEEGVVQIFTESDGNPVPLVAAVGELQLELFAWRMENEYNEKVKLERLPYTRTRWLGSEVRPATAVPIIFDDQQRPVAVFKNEWEINYALERTKDLILNEKPDA